jgi:hypothetical protein
LGGYVGYKSDLVAIDVKWNIADVEIRLRGSNWLVVGLWLYKEEGFAEI